MRTPSLPGMWMPGSIVKTWPGRSLPWPAPLEEGGFVDFQAEAVCRRVAVGLSAALSMSAKGITIVTTLK